MSYEEVPMRIKAGKKPAGDIVRRLSSLYKNHMMEES